MLYGHHISSFVSREGKGMFNCTTDATVMIYVQFSSLLSYTLCMRELHVYAGNDTLRSDKRLLLKITEPVGNGCT